MQVIHPVAQNLQPERTRKLLRLGLWFRMQNDGSIGAVQLDFWSFSVMSCQLSMPNGCAIWAWISEGSLEHDPFLQKCPSMDFVGGLVGLDCGPGLVRLGFHNTQIGISLYIF